MSYARFAGESDVYIFLDVGGYLNCCGCLLSDGSAHYRSTDAMIAHLHEHRKQGQRVPESAFEDLENDREENDEFIRSSDGGS